MLRSFQILIIPILVIILSAFSSNVSADTDAYQNVLTFGTYGEGEGELQNPYGLDVDEVSGDIYIADTGNSKIKKFNQFGEYLNSFGAEGTDDGEFLFPQGVALDSSNNDIYVADTASHRIQKFHINGDNYTFTLKFGSQGTGNGQFYLPRDIEVDSSGNVYVCDSGNNRISKFDSSGNWISNIGEDASLVSPYGLDLDDAGNIYVADTYNDRVVKFASNGTLLMEFGAYGTGAGEFTYPRDVAVDDNGNIFVADTENYRIQKFDSAGTYINSFGVFVEFLSPQKIVVDSDYKLYVIDSNTNRLQIYDVISYITNVYADPDPFSPDGDGFVDTTSIHYTIPEPAKITITIYDEDNNLVRDLITDAERVTDENEGVWDGRNNGDILVSAGVYTFKIDAVNALNYHSPQQSGTVSVIHPTGQIAGMVTDGTDPIEGAIVSDGVRSYLTDSNGDYSIINVPAGAYTVTASKKGCVDAGQLISIGEGEIITGVDFVLDCTEDPGTSQISGNVTDGTDPIEGATVSIENNTATTDSNGDYTISNLNAGTYTIIARKHLCTESSQEITVGADETITGIDFVLDCPDDPDIRVSPASLTLTDETGGGEPGTGIQPMMAHESEAALPEKDYEIRLKSRKFIPAEDDLRAQSEVAAVAQKFSGEKVHLLIQIEKIPTASEKRALKEAGIELLSYVPNYAWFAAVSAAKTSVLHAVPLVRWAGLLLPQDKLSLRIQDLGVGAWARNEDGTVNLLIQFFNDVPLNRAGQLVTTYGGSIVGKSSLLNVLTVSIPEDLINGLANEDIVQWIEEIPPPPIEHNDGVRQVTGVNIIQAPPYNLDGSNVTVGIWDGGHVDVSHDDFGTRVIYGDSGDVEDHPTHVGGTTGGDGTLSEFCGGSANQWRGVAPGVQIISYEWTDSTAEHNSAINSYGIDISQNSWGYWIDEALFDNCYLYGDYTLIVSEYDSIVRAGFGKRLGIVFSAGNERNDADCDIILNGGYQSIPPPATGKNIITVGAVNSDDDSMTSFSSWGPVDDGRIKPDVVAPGCEVGGEGYIHSTLPGDTYGGPGWCGTSMSAPVVSGTAALLIQQFRAIYDADPLPSTIKGVLMHTAIDLGNSGPDFETGYGRIDAQAAADIMQDKAVLEGTITTPGGIDTYAINVPEGTTELKVTLIWDDEPGIPNSAAELVNDLDLVLISPLSMQCEPWILNPNNPSAPATTGADRVNNIEQVHISNPTPGSWTVKVTGTTVPVPAQNYSLISFHFGSTAVEYSTERILTIYNEGVSNLVITDVSKTQSWLSVDQNSLNIAAGNSAVLKVSVDSADIGQGTYYDQIEISSNDPDEDLVIIPVIYAFIDNAEPDTMAPVISSVESSAGSDTDGVYETGSIVRIVVTEQNAEIGLTGTITVTSAINDPGIDQVPLSDNGNGTYYYDWDTIGLAPAYDYLIETTLEDAAENVGVGLPITMTLFASVDPDQSIVEVNPSNIIADGVSASTITVVPKDSFGAGTGPGQSVSLSTTAGTLLGSVTDHGDGTYNQALQSTTIEETTVITATVNGIELTTQPAVNFLDPAADPDNDGLTNDEEINIYGTDPFDPDSDDDGMADGWEVDFNLNPLVNDAFEDADGDGFCNWREYLAGTKPNDHEDIPDNIDIYVDDDNTSGIEDGSVSYPFNTIQEGVDFSGPGDTVFVSAGNYVENVLMNRDIFLVGEGAKVTIIDGSGETMPAICCLSMESGRIEGFHIQNGTGAGIRCEYTVMSIRRNVISSTSNGGGIKVGSASSVNVENNVIYENDLDGIAFEGLAVTIVNNSIVSNGGDGIGCFIGDGVMIKNNIIVSNGNYGISCNPSSDPEILYNDLWNNGTVDYFGCSAGAGDISDDPRFKDSVACDFHITSGSPCIDAGTSDGASEFDFDGNGRYDDPDTEPNTGVGTYTYYDIGAFEYLRVCEGDFDTDGDVDGSDLAVFAADFGRTDCGIGDPCDGDFDEDSDVDGSDLAVFAADFGRTDCPPGE